MGFVEENALWIAEKLGKFSGSGISRLLKGGTRPMTPEELAAREKGNLRKTVDILFGDGAHTYIREKYGEIIRQEPARAEISRAATEWGLAHEHEGVDFYQRITQTPTIEYYGGANPRFIPMPGFEKWAGVSLDGMVPGMKTIEGKCPFVAANHDLYMEFKDAADLKDGCPDYFAQMQMGFMCSGLNVGDFFSYDPRPIEPKYRMKIIEVQKDEMFCKHIEKCLKEAIKILQTKLIQPKEIEIIGRAKQ